MSTADDEMEAYRRVRAAKEKTGGKGPKKSQPPTSRPALIVAPRTAARSAHLPIVAQMTNAKPDRSIRPTTWKPEEALHEELRSTVQSKTISLDERLIAIIVPVLNRPDRVPFLVESFRKATSDKDAALYFVGQTSDVAEIEAIRKVGLEPLLVTDADRSWAKKINRGYERTAEPWLLLGADDLAFHTGWVDSVRSALYEYAGVIGTNDLGNPATVKGLSSTHPLVRRVYADVFGTADHRQRVVHEGYDHNFPDTELVQTAKRRGLYLPRTDCVIEHLHPLWGKGKHDRIYALGQANYAGDQKLFMARQARFGF